MPNNPARRYRRRPADLTFAVRSRWLWRGQDSGWAVSDSRRISAFSAGGFLSGFLSAKLASAKSTTGRPRRFDSCGTGGFFLASHGYIMNRYGVTMDRDQKRFLAEKAFRCCLTHSWPLRQSLTKLRGSGFCLPGFAIGTPSQISRCPPKRVNRKTPNPVFLGFGNWYVVLPSEARVTLIPFSASLFLAESIEATRYRAEGEKEKADATANGCGPVVSSCEIPVSRFAKHDPRVSFLGTAATSSPDCPS